MYTHVQTTNVAQLQRKIISVVPFESRNILRTASSIGIIKHRIIILRNYQVGITSEPRSAKLEQDLTCHNMLDADVIIQLRKIARNV